MRSQIKNHWWGGLDSWAWMYSVSSKLVGRSYIVSLKEEKGVLEPCNGSHMLLLLSCLVGICIMFLHPWMLPKVIPWAHMPKGALACKKLAWTFCHPNMLHPCIWISILDETSPYTHAIMQACVHSHMSPCRHGTHGEILSKIIKYREYLNIVDRFLYTLTSIMSLPLLHHETLGNEMSSI